jgi:mono/diheme cytochrome c family protein
MIKSVTEGRPGTAMVGHAKKLNAKEIEGVVDFIRSKYMQLAPSGRQASATAAPAAGSVGGAAVYKKHCAPCHGDDGNASSWARNSLIPPPRDFTAPVARSELSHARMIKSVTQGRPGTAMQPFAGRLAPAEIESVVQYIRTNFMKLDEGGVSAAQSAGAPATHPHRGPGAIPMTPPQAPMSASAPQAPVDMKSPFPNKLKGNPRNGEAFYMRNCVVCHGSNGDGNGPRAYFITPRPRNFTSEQSRQFYSRPQLFDAVTQGKRGTVMPAWGKVLDQQQIADVAEFVFQAYVRGTYKVTVRPDEDAKKK